MDNVANLPARKYPDFRKILADRVKAQEKEMKDLLAIQDFYQEITNALEANGFDKYVTLEIYGASLFLKITVEKDQWYRDRVLPVFYAIEPIIKRHLGTKEDGCVHRIEFTQYSTSIDFKWWSLESAVNLDTIIHTNGCRDITVTKHERTVTYNERRYHVASRELKKVLRLED